ncbi:MAG TPA: hypothetical protein VLM40_15490 [Gemmata sp.]|nr:hypothetical protein [Gemmata sp.]
MSKGSFPKLLAILLMCSLVYLAFKPEVGRDVYNWVHAQFSSGDMPKVTSPNYIPIVPGN